MALSFDSWRKYTQIPQSVKIMLNADNQVFSIKFNHNKTVCRLR